MTTGWAKLHNSLWSDKKWMRASLAARGLWASAVSYSNAMKTYGRIDGHLLALFQGTPELAAELVATGLWDEDGEGWQIHDWEQHQTSRERAEATSRVRAESGRRGGKASKQNRTDSSVTSDDKQFAKQREANASKPKQEEEVEVEEEGTTTAQISSAQSELLTLPGTPRKRGRAFVYPDAFEAWWKVWPKAGDTKRTAHTAWEKATKGNSRNAPRIAIAELQTAVEHYAADPNLPPDQFIPMASRWLNEDRWETGALPRRSGTSGRPQAGDTHAAMQRSHSAAQAYREIEESGYYDQQQITTRRNAS